MKRYAFPLTIILLLFAVIALAAPGDKHPAVTSAAIGLGTSSSPTLASVTATTSVTAPAYNSTAADGYHYVLPYNSAGFLGTPAVGMMQTTPTGPQWYTGTAWEAIGGAGDSLPTQTGNSGKYLTTNGSAASWGSIAAGSGIAISADIPTETGAANLNDSTHVLTVASTTGYTQFTGTHTPWDTTPDVFSFTDETDIAISTAKTSNAITVAGTNYPAAISVTGDTGYGYSKNSAACTPTSGTVVAGDTVAACVTSSGSNSTATTATITIGGVSDTYSVTTASEGPLTYTDSFTLTENPMVKNWTTAPGEGALRAYEGNAYATGSSGAAYYRAASFGPDQSSEITIASVTAQGIIVRCATTGSTDSFYWLYVIPGTSARLYRAVGGTGFTNTVQIGSTYTTSSPVVGDVWKLSIIGTSLTAYKNGVPVITATDSILTSGQPGITSNNGKIGSWTGTRL